MGDRKEEQALLVAELRQHEGIARMAWDVRVVLEGSASSAAWPSEIAGEIIDGLKDSEAEMLVLLRRGPAELYVANRVTREGPRRAYLLTDLQKKAPERYLFKAVRDFDLGLRLAPK